MVVARLLTRQLPFSIEHDRHHLTVRWRADGLHEAVECLPSSQRLFILWSAASFLEKPRQELRSGSGSGS